MHYVLTQKFSGPDDISIRHGSDDRAVLGAGRGLTFPASLAHPQIAFDL